MQGDHDSSRVARDELVLGSGSTLPKSPNSTTIVEKSVKTTTVQQIPHKPDFSQSSRMVSRFKSDEFSTTLADRIKIRNSECTSGQYSDSVANRIIAPQRSSSRKIYECRFAIFGAWAAKNKVVISEPTIPQIAEFFSYLFHEKNLKPATIAG